MAFILVTLSVMAASIFLIHKTTNRFGFHLKYSSLVFCAVLAFLINVTAMQMAPFLTAGHYISLFGLILVAAALVTFYNERFRKESSPAENASRPSVPQKPSRALEARNRFQALKEQVLADREYAASQKEAKKQRCLWEAQPTGTVAQRSISRGNTAPSPAKQETVAPAPLPAKQETVAPAPLPAKQETVAPAPSPAKQETVAPAPSPAKQETVAPAPSPAKQETVAPAPSPAKQETVAPVPLPAKQETVAPAMLPIRQETTAPLPVAKEQPAELPVAEKLNVETASLDELLDYAYEQNASRHAEQALLAYRSALRRFPDDSYIPFIIIDMANIYKGKAAYSDAIRTYKDALSLPVIAGNPATYEKFVINLSYLRTLQYVLSKHNSLQIPFQEIPSEYLEEIETEIQARWK